MKFYLRANNLLPIIIAPNNATDNDMVKAVIYIHRRVDKIPKAKYLTLEDPVKFWSMLQYRYEHQK